MKIGDEVSFLEIIQEIAKGKIKKDVRLRYEYGLTYRLYINDLKLIAYNGTGLYAGKILNDKFKILGYYAEED